MFAKVTARGANQVKTLANGVEQFLPFGREEDTSVAPLEQTYAKLHLEKANRTTNGSMR